MNQLKFSLQHAQAIVLQGNYDGSAADFSSLSRLVHTDLLENSELLPHSVCEDPGVALPIDMPQLFISGTTDIFYDLAHQQVRIYVKTPDRLHRHKLAVFIWQMSVIGASMAAMLRGSHCHLMHCAMLEKNNQALLLCGESGIGKSTSVKRYQAAGGTAVSDDMVLLEYAENEAIYVHRLPTWSACRESLEIFQTLSYPFNPPLELRGVLAVSRGKERESLEKISTAEFFAQVYRCVFFHYLGICNNLPDKEKKQLARVLSDACRKLTDRFQPQVFLAHLQGNIAETLGDLL